MVICKDLATTVAMHLCFDIETDGLLPTLTKLHCIVAMDVDTKEMESFGPDEIEAGIAYLQTASTLTGTTRSIRHSSHQEIYLTSAQTG